MAHLFDNATARCSLCRDAGPCFRLQNAACRELPEYQKDSRVGCFSCLHAGRLEFWHDTEIGLLDETGLNRVYKHNNPPPDNFPDAALIELRRTPQFITWQQGLWLVHCNDFMTYVGNWRPKDFYANAPDGDGMALFLEMTDKSYRHLWDASLPRTGKRVEHWHANYYAFRCLHCGKFRGNWDCD